MYGLVKSGTFRICCQNIGKQSDMLFYYCTVIACTDPPNTTTLTWAFHKYFDKEGSFFEYDAELIDNWSPKFRRSFLYKERSELNVTNLPNTE